MLATLLSFDVVLLTEVGDACTHRMYGRDEAHLRASLGVLGVGADRVVSIVEVVAE